MSAPQAFFINQVGGILFIIAIILSASLLFGEKQTIQNEK
jgi:NADH:ubiquinone oxidoreductase subunit 5 (subunit L)/multisubunit Na+/H+ antiporter MnhA subunit